MKDNEHDLLDDLDQLSDRAGRLDRFLNSRKVKNLKDPKEHKLMLIQLEIMEEYVEILKKRVKLHPNLTEFFNDY